MGIKNSSISYASFFFNLNSVYNSFDIGSSSVTFICNNYPFLLKNSLLLFPDSANDFGILPNVSIIKERWSSFFLYPSPLWGLNKKELVINSNTKQAHDQTSVFALYSIPKIASGERYSRVWILSVNFLFVQHALP